MNRSIIAISVVAIAALLWAVSPLPVGIAQDADSAPADDAILQLQQQRVAVLKMNVEAIDAQHSSGMASPDELFRAKDLLIEAKLELTAEPKDRIALLKLLLQNAQVKEERVAALHEIGAAGGSASELYLAKAARLSVEIRLAKANAS
ncbi:MAG: hypothetical protein ACE361_20300 [Aureliella sp.]